MLRRKPRPGCRTSSSRSKTTPAKVLEVAVKDALETELRPPRTPAVQQHLLEGGPTTTMLDLALGILHRLGDIDENDPEEIEFLEDCLKVGHSKTTLPCALVESKGTPGEVEDMLLNMYGSSLPRKSRESVSRAFLQPDKSGMDDDEDEDSDEDGDGPRMVVCRIPSSVMDAQAAADVKQLLKTDFDYWSFDMFRLAKSSNGRPLLVAGYEAFHRNNLFYAFPVDPAQVKAFLSLVEAKYCRAPGVPYHNSTHAADVAQCVHALLGDIGFQEYFDSLSVLSLVTSAAIHDMGHDGRTNNFHVNAQDNMALTYNDKSVLENFHVSEAFRLLSAEPQANFLSGLAPDQYSAARKQIIEEVLGTDMANHFGHLGSLKAISQKLPEEDPDGWIEDTEAASALRVMMLHASDVGNPMKSLTIADRWAGLLRTEFFQQGDIERGLGLPISPLCDRNTVKFASSQVGFMQFIVRPTFEVLVPLAPRVKEVLLTQMDANLEVWVDRKEREASPLIGHTSTVQSAPPFPSEPVR